MSYEDSSLDVNELFEEQEYRHLWLFLYSSRHAHLELNYPQNLEEQKQLICYALDLLKKFHPREVESKRDNIKGLIESLEKFCLGVTYAFHKENISDGFEDIRIQAALSGYLEFLKTLSKEETNTVKRLHELTYEYGFPIMQLWTMQHDAQEIMNNIIYATLHETHLRRPYLFTFAKKSNHPDGIQVSIPNYKSIIEDEWDIEIFIHENDKISKIDNQMKEVWSSSEKQRIGIEENHFFALYIDRKSCTRSRALSFLDLQKIHLSQYLNPDFLDLPISWESLDNPRKLKKSDIKKSVKNVEKYLEGIRWSEGMTSKRWDNKKNNLRRAIGLYLWDQTNLSDKKERSRKELIKSLINELKTNTPEILDLYLGKFNKSNTPSKNTTFGDTEESNNVVVREMEADYDLTAHCIEHAEYYTPFELKTFRKS